MRKFYFTVLTFFLPLISFSQTIVSENVEMADIWRSNGKIYVVIACIGIIFAGLILHLISLERRLQRMEKEKQK